MCVRVDEKPEIGLERGFLPGKQYKDMKEGNNILLTGLSNYHLK